ncbi:MAG: hypothetical protein WCH01_07440 [Methylococcaceae bacterium]
MHAVKKIKIRRELLMLIRSFESTLDGEDIKVVMYQRQNQYGVAIIHKNMVSTKDYRGVIGARQMLRTFIGLEANVIDWVSFEEANIRYTTMLNVMLNSGEKTNQSIANFGKPSLQLVCK